MFPAHISLCRSLYLNSLNRLCRRLGWCLCRRWDWEKTYVEEKGEVLPYMGNIGLCRWIGCGVLGSPSLNRVSVLPLLALCS